MKCKEHLSYEELMEDYDSLSKDFLEVFDKGVLLKLELTKAEAIIKGLEDTLKVYEDHAKEMRGYYG